MTANTYTPAADVAAQIDAMVAERDGRPTASAYRSSGHASMKMNADGTVEITGGGAIDTSPGTLDATDLQYEHQRLIDLVESAEADLEAHTFDPASGAKIPVLSPTEREQKEREIEVLKMGLDYTTQRYNAALQARAERGAAKSAEDKIAAAKHAFASGDPERMALLEKAVAEVEARELAAEIVRARRAKADQ